MVALARNALGGGLELCGRDPKTGFLRDGFCNTGANDLVTPLPAYDFPGLRDGDRWCLCAMRWHEAHLAGVAPPLYLQATHARVLDLIDLDILLPYALDLPQNA